MKTLHINKHNHLFRCDFTISFNVKQNFITIPYEEKLYLSYKDAMFEEETGHFINYYSEQCFRELKKISKCLTDYSFEGRSNGWFVLIFNGCKYTRLTENQKSKIAQIVYTYNKGYNKAIYDAYNETNEILNAITPAKELKTVEDIKQAVNNGLYVYWSNPSYKVIKDNSYNQYLIHHIHNDYYTGLTYKDGITLNGDIKDFHILID